MSHKQMYEVRVAFLEAGWLPYLQCAEKEMTTIENKHVKCVCIIVAMANIYGKWNRFWLESRKWTFVSNFEHSGRVLNAADFNGLDAPNSVQKAQLEMANFIKIVSGVRMLAQ